MRNRLPIILAALMILPALFVAGCGDDDEPTTTTAPTQTTAATPETSSTGPTGDESASESAKRALDNCLAAADRLPDASNSRKAKKQCQDAYDNIKDATKKADESVSEARENCKQAAESIPDGQAKEDALAACEKFQ